MERLRPDGTADERAMLTGWLTWQHQTVDLKCVGLSEDDARRTPLATSPDLSISALVSHLTSVERDWLEGSFLGDEGLLTMESGGGWDIGGQALPELLAGYRRQGARTQEIVAGYSLDQLEAYSPPGLELVSLRWIVTHLIEETGRHLGHLDLLREMADGSRGQ
ncbi:MAG TPA: DinB family protein [Microlunatus sp.]|nr:DinB family protein [Microlunatus sp.]